MFGCCAAAACRWFEGAKTVKCCPNDVYQVRSFDKNQTTSCGNRVTVPLQIINSWVTPFGEFDTSTWDVLLYRMSSQDRWLLAKCIGLQTVDVIIFVILLYGKLGEPNFSESRTIERKTRTSKHTGTHLNASRDGPARLVAPVDDAGAVVGGLQAESQAAVGITVERHLFFRAGMMSYHTIKEIKHEDERDVSEPAEPACGRRSRDK